MTETKVSAGRSRVLTGDNPFDVDPDSDLLNEPLHHLPHWNEAVYCVLWSPQQSIGVWVHAGVLAEDKDMWWSHTHVLLPGGVVLVDRSFGRRKDYHGVDTGALSIKCVEPLKRWTLSFDGAGQISSTDELAQGLVGAGIVAPVSFEIELEALLPVYDMRAATGAEGLSDWAGSMHLEQAMSARGRLTAMGQTFEIDGPAIRDHSRGERNFEDFGGHVWNFTVWPQSRRALGVFSQWDKANRVKASVVLLMEEGRTELSSDFDISGKTAVGGYPRDMKASVIRADGSRVDLTGEVVHNLTVTYAEPNHNLNGHLAGRDDLVADDSIVAWTWPDGEVGYANMERGFRSSALPCPKIPLPAGSPFAEER